MTSDAKAELAKAILRTFKKREASYSGSGKYGISYDKAAQRECKDKDIAIIVSCLLTAGYGEVMEWAEQWEQAK